MTFWLDLHSLFEWTSLFKLTGFFELEVYARWVNGKTYGLLSGSFYANVVHSSKILAYDTHSESLRRLSTDLVQRPDEDGVNVEVDASVDIQNCVSEQVGLVRKIGKVLIEVE